LSLAPCMIRTRQSGRHADLSRRTRAGRRTPSAGRSLRRPRTAVQAASRCWASREARTPRPPSPGARQLAAPPAGDWPPALATGRCERDAHNGRSTHDH
jgi:hypothetical protein